MPEAKITSRGAARDLLLGFITALNREQLTHSPSPQLHPAMAPPEPAVKRSFSTFSEQPAKPDAKRIKRPYHHHHRLRDPVDLSLPEPAIADDAYVDGVMNRIIGQSLQNSGFEIADPLAVESFRDAAEECMLCTDYKVSL